MDSEPPTISRASGVRAGWSAVPPAVVAGIVDVVGSEIVTAQSQPDGFSPGPAVRCRLRDGRRVFVKAVSGAMNADAPKMHRAEAENCKFLPGDLPAPRFLGTFDNGDWVALVFEDIEGRHPSLPWKFDELTCVIRGLGDLHARLTPNPVPFARPAADRHRDHFSGFRRLLRERVTGLDPWIERNLGHLANLESAWESVAQGDTLVHGDMRSDNILLTGIASDLRAWFVDWPHACVSCAWFDIVAMAPSIRLEGGPSPSELIRMDPACQELSNDQLAPLVAYFLSACRQPDPPGLPTLRDFQARQGAVAVEWLKELMDY